MFSYPHAADELTLAQEKATELHEKIFESPSEEKEAARKKAAEAWEEHNKDRKPPK